MDTDSHEPKAELKAAREILRIATLARLAHNGADDMPRVIRSRSRRQSAIWTLPFKLTYAGRIWEILTHRLLRRLVLSNLQESFAIRTGARS